MKVVKLPSQIHKEKERNKNINQLKILISQYVKVNQNEVLKKVKNEQ